MVVSLASVGRPGTSSEVRGRIDSGMTSGAFLRGITIHEHAAGTATAGNQRTRRTSWRNDDGHAGRPGAHVWAESPSDRCHPGRKDRRGADCQATRDGDGRLIRTKPFHRAWDAPAIRAFSARWLGLHPEFHRGNAGARRPAGRGAKARRAAGERCSSQCRQPLAGQAQRELVAKSRSVKQRCSSTSWSLRRFSRGHSSLPRSWADSSRASTGSSQPS